MKKRTTENTEGKVGWFSEIKISQLFPEGKGIWIAGVVGSLMGGALLGTERGYVLGLPCILIYRVIHGLLIGKILWWTGMRPDGYHVQFCTRRDDSVKYWLAVAIYLLGAWWIFAFFIV